MPPSQAAAIAATLVAVVWALRRRRPVPLVRNADTSAVAALNRAQIERLSNAPVSRLPGTTAGQRQSLSAVAPASPALAASASSPRPRLDATARRRLQAELRSGFQAGGSARLAAITAARAWGHPATLPMLRLALRDPDPAVVREAAAAIERFRGRPAPAVSRPQARPRRVARTR